MCGNCSNEYPDSLKVCPKCGARGGEAPVILPQEHSDDAQVAVMQKGNRLLLLIMSIVFALFIAAGFFVKGQGPVYITCSILFFPVFVVPMLFMKKWAAYAVLITQFVLVFMAMLALIGGAYSSPLAISFGIISAIFFFSYMIVIFENMDAMK